MTVVSPLAPARAQLWVGVASTWGPCQGKSLATGHGLRATGISLLALAGVPLWKVHTMAGHADIRITERHYLAKPDVTHLADAAAVFDEPSTTPASQ